MSGVDSRPLLSESAREPESKRGWWKHSSLPIFRISKHITCKTCVHEQCNFFPLRTQCCTKTPKQRHTSCVSDIATIERARDQTLLHGDRKNRSGSRSQSNAQPKPKVPSENNAKSQNKEKSKESKTCSERCRDFPCCCIGDNRVSFHFRLFILSPDCQTNAFLVPHRINTSLSL